MDLDDFKPLLVFVFFMAFIGLMCSGLPGALVDFGEHWLQAHDPVLQRQAATDGGAR